MPQDGHKTYSCRFTTETGWSRWHAVRACSALWAAEDCVRLHANHDIVTTVRTQDPSALDDEVEVEVKDCGHFRVERSYEVRLETFPIKAA